MSARAAFAERGDCGDDQPPMGIAHSGAVHRDCGALGRRDVMDQDVGARQQIIQAAAVRGVVQVERHPALVGVQGTRTGR